MSYCPNYTTLSTHLTNTQRLVWERLSNPPRDALTYNGCVATEYLAGVWGDTPLPGWRTLVHVNIHNINKRIIHFGIQIRGQKAIGGYRIVNESRPQ